MSRRPASIRSSILLFVLAAGGVALLLPGGWVGALTRWRVDTHTAIEFFKREPLSFLVTERIVTQVVVEKHAGNLLLGEKDGFLFGTVELLYGVDLATLDADAIRKQDDGIHVRVPAPTLLRAVPDLDSVRFLQKRSPMMVVADKLSGDDFYRACLLELDDAALAFAREHDLVPTREQLIQRLNDYAPAVAGKLGTAVKFE